MEEKLVGKVSHYFTHIGVAVIDLSGELKVGDIIAIVAKDGTKVEQAVTSMQIEKAQVPSAKKGQSIGLKVNGRVHEGDSVLKIS